MGVFHTEEEKQRELAAFEAERQKKANFGKKVLWVVVIWDAVFAVLNTATLNANLFDTVFAFALYFLFGFISGCGLVAFDLTLLLGGRAWARMLRGIFAFIIMFCDIPALLGAVMMGNVLVVFSFIGNFAVGLFLFGSRSVQKYIEMKRKAH